MPSWPQLCWPHRRAAPMFRRREMDTIGFAALPPGQSGDAPDVGFINRLPPDSLTAQFASHVRNLQVGARRERDEMRRALDSIGIGFWDWDIPSLQVWYSSHVRELLGYEAGDPVWQSNIFRGLVHPEDLPRTEAEQNGVLYDGKDDYRAEFRIRHKNGRWVWIEAIGRAVVRAEDGTTLRMAGMFTGIDQRKQEQADAAFTTDLCRAMLREKDPEEIKRIAVRALGTYLGVDRISYARLSEDGDSLIFDQNWTGSDVPAFTGNWQSSIFRTATKLFLEGGEVVVRDVGTDSRMDVPGVRERFEQLRSAAIIAIPLVRDGAVKAIFVVTHSTPRNWQDHEVALVRRVASRLWDSVLRARAEEASRSDKALLELASTMSKIGARQRNLTTGEITTSDNFYNVIGHPDAVDMSAEEYLAHVHPEDRETLRRDFMRPMRERGDGVFTGEHRIITADEQIRHIALMAQYHFPRSEPGERHAYSIAIMQDVTEQRERDLAAKEAQLKLLKHSRLSAMGMMASTLAHELNQPLTVAANYLALLEALSDSAGFDRNHLKTYTQRATDKVLEAGEIIRRIRSFTVDGSVKTAPLLLRDLVYRALSALFGSMGAREMSIINAVPRKMRVQVDAVMIENTIINIVRNAVEALAGRPGAQIRISARIDGHMAALRIADNGPGMTDEIATNVFSPFVTAKANGNGLGLPLCRTMVEANGGKLTLESHGADGTAFCICLPLADTPDTEVGEN